MGISKRQGLGLWLLNATFNFQQYFSYIVEVRFITGGNRSTRKKNHEPTTNHRQTLSHNPLASLDGFSRSHGDGLYVKSTYSVGKMSTK
jgi:hypothetical protein